MSTIHTVLDDTPHGCSVTPSPCTRWRPRPRTGRSPRRTARTRSRTRNRSGSRPRRRRSAGRPRPSTMLRGEEVGHGALEGEGEVLGRVEVGGAEQDDRLADLLALAEHVTHVVRRTVGAELVAEQVEAGPPHDGVAALAVPAVSAPAAPTPPTMVSVAAAASTLLLMDIGVPLLNSQPRPARGCVELAPAAHDRIFPRSIGTLPGSRWTGQAGTAACRSCGLERHGSGHARDPYGEERSPSQGRRKRRARWLLCGVDHESVKK